MRKAKGGDLPAAPDNTPEVFILDKLLSESPTCEEFTVPLGEKEDQFLRFRMVQDFTELQRLKQKANATARDLYSELVEGHDPKMPMDETRVATIAQCVMMQSLSKHELGVVTVEKLYDLSVKFGSVFGAIVQVFSSKLAIGEAKAFNKKAADSKND